MNGLEKNAVLALTRFIPDELYLRIAYRCVTGKRLHLNPPVTYNEKLQWLKLHNRQSEYTSMVDKYEVRKFVAERVGEEYLVKTLGVWNKAEEIDSNVLEEIEADEGQENTLDSLKNEELKMKKRIVVARDNSYDYESSFDNKKPLKKKA